MKGNKIIKNVVLLMILTLLSKFIGFFRELVMGYCYGATIHSDAYFAAYDIPKILFSIIAAALSTTFIPMYNRVKEEKGNDRAILFTNNVMNLTMIIGILISIIAFIFMKNIVGLFAIGFKGQAFTETVLFTRIILLGYIFSGLSSVMGAFLQYNDEFFIPGIIGIPYNLVVIVFMLLSVYFKNIYLLPIGACLGLMSQFLFQVPKSKQLGYKPKVTFNIKDEYITKMLILVGPILISTAVAQINRAVDNTLASTLVVGSLSSLNYSNKLIGFVMGLFITTISVVIYPQLSKLSYDDDKNKFNSLVNKLINIVFMIIIPITFICIIMSTPIVRTLFMRGAFDEQAANLTSVALIFFSVGMIGLAMRTVIMNVFYSLGDTKTPMINSIITVVLNIAMNFILIGPMANGGLALATSLSYIASMIMLLYSLRKKIGNFGIKNINFTTIKVFMSSVIMAIIIKIIYDILIGLLGSSTLIVFINLIISVIIGLIVYVILVKKLKIDEVEYMFNEIKKYTKKFRKVKNKS